MLSSSVISLESTTSRAAFTTEIQNPDLRYGNAETCPLFLLNWNTCFHFLLHDSLWLLSTISKFRHSLPYGSFNSMAVSPRTRNLFPSLSCTICNDCWVSPLTSVLCYNLNEGTQNRQNKRPLVVWTRMAHHRYYFKESV